MLMPKTSDNCLRAAMQALVRGDTAERDRLVRRGEMLMRAEEQCAAVARVLSVDFYVDSRGRAFPSATMARAAGVVQ